MLVIKKFKVTKDHIKLLKKMIVAWDSCEFGAPCINPKRPYGNSDVLSDMGKILGIKPDKDEQFGYLQESKLCDLHKEMETVIQILLRNGQLKTGEYQCEEYSRDWKRKNNL